MSPKKAILPGRRRQPTSWIIPRFGWASLALATLALQAGAEPARSIVLGELPLLFADDAGVLACEGLVRTLHPAHTLPSPVVEADRPWEGGRVYIFGTVVPVEGLGGFVMWYLSKPALA